MQFLCRGPPTFTRWLRTWRCEKVLSPLVALPQPRVNSGPLTLWEGPESTCSPSMATSRLRTQHYEKVESICDPQWPGPLMWLSHGQIWTQDPWHCERVLSPFVALPQPGVESEGPLKFWGWCWICSLNGIFWGHTAVYKCIKELAHFFCSYWTMQNANVQVPLLWCKGQMWITGWFIYSFENI